MWNTIASPPLPAGSFTASKHPLEDSNGFRGAPLPSHPQTNLNMKESFPCIVQIARHYVGDFFKHHIKQKIIGLLLKTTFSFKFHFITISLLFFL
jgi:hypothetical protein